MDGRSVSEESVERMVAFAALLAALENQDREREDEARSALRRLGLVITFAEEVEDE